MEVEVLITLVGILSAVGAVLFLIARLVFKKEIGKNPRVEKSIIYIAFGVLVYFAATIVLSFSGQKIIAQIMLLAIFVFCLVGVLRIKKNHE